MYIHKNQAKLYPLPTPKYPFTMTGANKQNIKNNPIDNFLYDFSEIMLVNLFR